MSKVVISKLIISIVVVSLNGYNHYNDKVDKVLCKLSINLPNAHQYSKYFVKFLKMNLRFVHF